MRKIIFCWLIFFVFIAVSSDAAADDINTGEPAAIGISSSTPIAVPVLVISPAPDNPDEVFYNAGDRGKLFLSFDLFASSSADLYIDSLGFKIINSISSAFLNPGLRGDNIVNIAVADGSSGENLGSLDAINISENVKTFSGLNLSIGGGTAVKIHVYADVSEGIRDAVLSRIALFNPASVRAINADTGEEVAVIGGAEGEWIDLKAAEPKPDLSVSGVYFNQSRAYNNIVVNEPVYINVIYKNSGNGSAPEDFSKIFDFGSEDIFEFGNNGEPISSSSSYSLSSGNLYGSEEYAELYAGIFREAGEIKVKITLDPEDSIREINDRNNVFVEDLIVFAELNYPDFIVYDIITDPVSPVAGEEVRLDVVYKNIGSDYDRDKFSTLVYFGQAEGWFIFNDQRSILKSRSYPNLLAPLKTGETITETYWGRFGRDREIEMEATVDSFKEVEEANENNNRFKKKIIIRKKEAVAAVNGGALAAKLKGKIVLRVEAKGEAYYINPLNSSVNFLGRPEDAFKVMREQGVGIKTSDLNKIPVGLKAVSGADADKDGLSDSLEDAIGSDPDLMDTDKDGLSDYEELERGSDPVSGRNLAITADSGFAGKQKGKIFLQIEKSGEAWYVNPTDGKRYFLGRPADAFAVMRVLGLGISNSDFNKL